MNREEAVYNDDDGSINEEEGSVDDPEGGCEGTDDKEGDGEDFQQAVKL